MIKTAYDAGHATAVMLEGDASLRLMGLWGRPVALGEKGQTKRGVQSAGIHLADVYSELEKSPWDICQLCLLTMPQKNRIFWRSCSRCFRRWRKATPSSTAIHVVLPWVPTVGTYRHMALPPIPCRERGWRGF